MSILMSKVEFQSLLDRPNICAIGRGTSNALVEVCMSKEVVAKGGCRCKNGCLGEGAILVTCKDHITYLEDLAEHLSDWRCSLCDQETLELFPIQKIEA